VLIIFAIIAEHVCANSVSDWSLRKDITNLKQREEDELLSHCRISITAKYSEVRCKRQIRWFNQGIFGRSTDIFRSAAGVAL
jgi:hypothetical protein